MNHDFAQEDSEYIFVELEEGLESENESFDFCDEEELSLSQSPSVGASVCSESMLLEPFSPDKSSAGDEEDVHGIISNSSYESSTKLLETNESPHLSHLSPDDEVRTEKTKTGLTQKGKEDGVTKALRYTACVINMRKMNNINVSRRKNTSRISNKKRRKLMKRQKKAAAEKAIADALASQRTLVLPKLKGKITKIAKT